jgi:hypothetical protein
MADLAVSDISLAPGFDDFLGDSENRSTIDRPSFDAVTLLLFVVLMVVLSNGNVVSQESGAAGVGVGDEGLFFRQGQLQGL